MTSTSNLFRRVNPISGEVASEAPAQTPDEAIAAVDAAARAMPAWAAQGPNARRAALLKAADAVSSKGDAFVTAMMAEIGATEAWARFNVMLAASMLREAASLTTQVAGRSYPFRQAGLSCHGHSRTSGRLLGIAPWNAPVILGVRAVGHSSGLRQCSGVQSKRTVPENPWPYRRGPGGGRIARGVSSSLSPMRRRMRQTSSVP